MTLHGGHEISWFARTFPVPAPSWVAPGLTLSLVIGAAGRAQDYLTRSVSSDGITRGVEVAGFAVWGGLFAALAIASVLGVVALNAVVHSRWPVLISHVFGAGVHVSYVLALADAVGGSGRGLGVVMPPLAAAAIHLVCVGLYVGPRPRKVKPPRGD
ncbi:hypothetical protein [Modestobacter sp. VKM Ac-2985]|uniref:hypothetical protein n=1 Tax=Modestobacter sp. VKM Ac-2985 TaxID=3004139 RepID=UPI0022AB86E4|nr:hypothetical protein [Modestobacter sp. VKM Ac-2985]MCZ2837130.1 hypothetical protein [Modestobacter sp. VKM Ac-2985]